MGPGSKEYLTSYSMDIIKKSRFIIGYKYTLNTIKHLLDRSYHQIFEITMKSQEDVYLNVFNNLMNENDICTVPFTGDVNFSESEVVDRLLNLFGDNNVEIIPGISSIQIASAKSRVPLDKANIITFHVTGDIEEKKIDLLSELNIFEQVTNVAETTILQEAWANGQAVAIHGWIYRLSEGIFQDLKVTVGGFEDLADLRERSLLRRKNIGAGK